MSTVIGNVLPSPLVNVIVFKVADAVNNNDPVFTVEVALAIELDKDNNVMSKSSNVRVEPLATSLFVSPS